MHTFEMCLHSMLFGLVFQLNRVWPQFMLKTQYLSDHR